MNLKKIHKELAGLKALGRENFLHPLKQTQIKQAMMARLNTETDLGGEAFNRQERRNKVMKYLIPILAGLSILGGTALASSNARPGDVLFPVKKLTEQVELSLAGSDQARTNLQIKFAEKRLEELNDLEGQTTATGTPASVNLGAQTQAQNEVSSAITTLQGVRADLQAKGNTAAADAVGQTIAKLQAKMETHGREEKDRENKDSGDEEEQNGFNFGVGATSTSSSTLPILRQDGQQDEPDEIESEDENNDNATINTTTNLQIENDEDSQNSNSINTPQELNGPRRRHRGED